MHDDDAVGHLGDDAHVVRDQDQRHPEFPLQVPDQRQDLGLDGHVERRRRLVGNQDLGPERQRDGDHHALAHAAGELVRVLRQPPFGLGDADRLERGDRGRARLACADRAMRQDRLGQLPPDRQHRIERGHRLLEDHGDLGAAHLAHLALAERRQFAAAERDAAAGNPRHRLGQKPHDRKRRHRLAGARLAGDAQRLAGGDVEGDVVDDRAPAARRRNLGREAADGEDWFEWTL